MVVSSITLLLPALLATAGGSPASEPASVDTKGTITGPFEIRGHLGLGVQSKERDTDPFVSIVGLALGYRIFPNVELGASGYVMPNGFMAGPFLRVMSTEPWGPSAEVFSTFGHVTDRSGYGVGGPAYGFGFNFGLHKPLSEKVSTWLGLSIARPQRYGKGAKELTYVLLAFELSVWP
jgi:hypothetical protein